ncbi:LysR family transcriptional regulator [Chachezhania antarctica]|uniref:LysR family transcriptional regulator n=1 Tax=Chachezhania antarctica TaxID=2340860 RepID=UPI0013CEF921|nr:LysR family transcriptional regulator [Chachezhania antarctica]|tara:strand:- start:14621 stop:15544 length:924 start_codon:yes stop_codon:yes gene_type:complete
MRPITLQRLQVFCAVYDHDSISGAARHLRLTQPTVSRHLRDFEAALGLSLFVLDKGRVMPTAEAEVIRGECRFLFEGMTRLENRIDALQKGVGQTLSVMTINMLSIHFVPEAVRHLLSQLPELNVVLDVGTLAQQLHALRAGQVDVCIVAGKVQVEDVELERIGQGRLQLLTPPDGPLAGDGPLPMSELDTEALLGSTLRGPVGKVLADALAGKEIAFQPQITVKSLSMVPPLAQTMGVASIADEFTAYFQNNTGFQLRDLDLVFDIYAMSVGPVSHRSAARLLIDRLGLLLADWTDGHRPPRGRVT